MDRRLVIRHGIAGLFPVSLKALSTGPSSILISGISSLLFSYLAAFNAIVVLFCLFGNKYLPGSHTNFDFAWLKG
jgi:hypothetical protein